MRRYRGWLIGALGLLLGLIGNTDFGFATSSSRSIQDDTTESGRGTSVLRPALHFFVIKITIFVIIFFVTPTKLCILLFLAII